MADACECGNEPNNLCGLGHCVSPSTKYHIRFCYCFNLCVSTPYTLCTSDTVQAVGIWLFNVEYQVQFPVT